jgi:hypothetical protein
METKQTAMQWFNQQLVERQNGNGDRRSWDEILREALQMEREQIIESFMEGTKMDNINDELSSRFNACIYYGENYGGEK